MHALFPSARNAEKRSCNRPMSSAAVRFLVELHPRANVPELIIKPTVDDWS